VILALCTSLRDASTSQLKDPTYCAQFVGASWIPHFIRMAEERGHQVVAGKEAREMPAGMVHVIQEDQESYGRELIERGAQGSVLFCLESPLYVPDFYDGIEADMKFFRHTWSFTHGERIPFPSFDEEMTFKTPKAWNLRRPLVMVASNKHYSSRVLPWSKSYQAALENQLQDHRYTVIGTLKDALGIMDLYGKGWPQGYAPEIRDKIACIENYKYAVCFENLAMPGYVTEKIIDCLVAGVVPIYFGAPDIGEIIPKHLYINFRHFNSWPDCLNWIGAGSHERRIDEGRQWLKTEAGKRYSYQGFARRMAELACA